MLPYCKMIPLRPTSQYSPVHLSFINDPRLDCPFGQRVLPGVSLIINRLGLLLPSAGPKRSHAHSRGHWPAISRVADLFAAEGELSGFRTTRFARMRTDSAVRQRASENAL